MRQLKSRLFQLAVIRLLRLGRVQSIATFVSVCLSVCLFPRIFQQVSAVAPGSITANVLQTKDAHYGKPATELATVDVFEL